MELRGVDGQQVVEVFEVAKEREKYRLPIEEGYVIRCHDLSYDSTYYRGKNQKGSYYRDKIPMGTAVPGTAVPDPVKVK